MELRRIRHGVVDSTNERAFAALAAGEAEHLDLHVAEGQTRGRGRHGRAWFSAPGEGLYASLVLRPERPFPPPSLTVAAGLATLDAVQASGLAGAHLDWPNDVVFDGAKLAGILVETRGLDPARPHYVIGVGLNVAQRDFPAELTAERAVTSLARAGVSTTPSAVEGELARCLAERIDQLESDPARLEREYPPAAGLVGEIEVRSADDSVTGRLVGFGFERGLAVETPTRRVEMLLEHVRAAAPVAS